MLKKSKNPKLWNYVKTINQAFKFCLQMELLHLSALNDLSFDSSQ